MSLKIQFKKKFESFFRTEMYFTYIEIGKQQKGLQRTKSQGQKRYKITFSLNYFKIINS